MMSDEHFKTAIELCCAVYRVTERFPSRETLCFKLRELSLDIIKFLVYNGAYSARPAHRPTLHDGQTFDLEGFRKKLQELLIYCEIAKEQGWVDPRNFEVLSSVYKDLCGNVEQGLNRSGFGGETTRMVKTEGRGPKAADLSPRKLQIVRFLKSSDSGVSMADFAKLIKGKSRKTIERDLKYLIGANLVLKKGRTKGARFYPLSKKEGNFEVVST